MAHPSPPTVLALLGLRLKGFASSLQIGQLVGLSEAATNAALQDAADFDQVVYRNGQRTGWALKPAGRTEIERMLADELEITGLRPLVHSAYDRFMSLNNPMLAVCTRWQVKDLETHLLNNHDDPAYDQAVIAELAELDAAVQPICTELSQALARFAIYSPRFSSALAKIESGDRGWFTAPIKESYHTVWFELHEDLLATLGIDRASERAHHAYT